MHRQVGPPAALYVSVVEGTAATMPACMHACSRHAVRLTSAAVWVLHTEQQVGRLVVVVPLGVRNFHQLPTNQYPWPS